MLLDHLNQKLQAIAAKDLTRVLREAQSATAPVQRVRGADGRPLLHHVQEWVERHEQAFEQRHAVSTVAVRRKCMVTVDQRRISSTNGTITSSSPNWTTNTGFLAEPSIPVTSPRSPCSSSRTIMPMNSSGSQLSSLPSTRRPGGA